MTTSTIPDARMKENRNSFTRSRGYKKFHAQLAEHQNLNAHKLKKNHKIQLFSDSHKPRKLFFPAHKC